MTADLTRNESGKEVKIPQDDVSIRGERLAFMEGVCWATAHMYEAARRIEPDRRAAVSVEGRDDVEVIVMSGQPAFAAKLRELAQVLEVEGWKEGRKRFPNFDPIPEPMKSGQSSGF